MKCKLLLNNYIYMDLVDKCKDFKKQIEDGSQEDWDPEIKIEDSKVTYITGSGAGEYTIQDNGITFEGRRKSFSDGPYIWDNKELEARTSNKWRLIHSTRMDLEPFICESNIKDHNMYLISERMLMRRFLDRPLTVKCIVVDRTLSLKDAVIKYLNLHNSSASFELSDCFKEDHHLDIWRIKDDDSYILDKVYTNEDRGAYNPNIVPPRVSDKEVLIK